MEHLSNTEQLYSRTGITDSKKLSLLTAYAEAIHTENLKYNLTGHKTLSDIIDNLIIGSLEPVKNFNVPRGTLFGDLGTGAGIPGIPLAIKYDECRGILFDSNQKKIRFINKIVSELGIGNVRGVDIRVEDAGREESYREQLDFIFTRAMSDIYTIAELGSPLLKTSGFIYLYVTKSQIELNDYLMEHITDLGLSSDTEPVLEDMTEGGITEGMILVKIKETDIKYPRRMPVIKRMASK